MTQDEANRAQAAIYAAMTPAEKIEANKFFGGRVSTRTQRDALRAALASSGNVQLVSDLRAYFNTMRIEGETITWSLVSAATRALGSG